MVDKFYAWLMGLSLKEIIIIVAIIVVFVLLLKVVKKILKFVVVVAFIICLLLYFGIITPEHIKTSAELLADKATETELLNISELSDSVRITDGVVEFKIADTWYSIDDVKNVKSDSSGLYKLVVNDGELPVDNADVEKLWKIIIGE